MDASPWVAPPPFSRPGHASCGATSPTNFAGLLPRALNEVAQQFDNRNERARVAAAKTILRLVGVKSAIAIHQEEED
jgi:hypothetical protein